MSKGDYILRFDVDMHSEIELFLNSFEKNMENPLLAMFYGFSISACMSSALSEPGGAGLGTLGFNPQVAREMTSEAGFTRFTEHDFGEAANLYYEVRP